MISDSQNPNSLSVPRIRILALPESSSTVLYGLNETLSTFGAAWAWAMGEDGPAPAFDVAIAGVTRDTFACWGGAPVAPRLTLDEADDADIAVVTDLAVDPAEDHRGRWPEAEAWLRRMAGGGATVCSVCSGSVLLAAAGLLDGLPATTHWLYVDHFRRFFPEVDLQPGRILVPAGPDTGIVTAGGMASWEDLVLYLIARHHGEAAAVNAAKLFLFGDRSEGQLLYAARIRPKRHDDGAVAVAQDWIADHYSAPNPVARVVESSGLAERTFKRRFRKATGYAPIEYVQTLRIEEAKQMLESGNMAIDTVAGQIGYEDPTSFRRLFKRLVGVTPGRYRQRYRTIGRAVE